MFPRYVHTYQSVSSVALSDDGLTMWARSTVLGMSWLGDDFVFFYVVLGFLVVLELVAVPAFAVPAFEGSPVVLAAVAALALEVAWRTRDDVASIDGDHGLDADRLFDTAESVFSRLDWEAEVFQRSNLEKIFAILRARP